MGKIIYLKVEVIDGTKTFVGFSETPREGFSKYGIEILSKASIIVISNMRQVLKSEYYTHIVNNRYLEGYISNEDLSKAFDNMDDIDLTQAYKTERRESTFQYQIYGILSRLDLIDRLYKIARKPENFILADPLSRLITHLLMTCCDKLGQTSEFIPFNNWLNSKQETHLKQKEEAIDKISKLSINEPVEISKEMYNTYIEYYGTRNSFDNFFNKCPSDLLNYFLSSFNIIKYPFPISEDCYNYSNEEKRKFLFDNRNSYTHNVFTRSFFPASFTSHKYNENGQIMYSFDQMIRNSEGKCYLVNIEVSNLFYPYFIKCIKTVLAEDIRNKFLLSTI